MNKTETAQLLTIASMIDNRTVAPETVEAWHMVLGSKDFGHCKMAMALHFAESDEYLMPAHVSKNLPRVRRKIQQDVRAAKARGLIGAEHGEDDALPGEVEDRLAAARKADGEATSRFMSLTEINNPDAWMNQPAEELGVGRYV